MHYYSSVGLTKIIMALASLLLVACDTSDQSSQRNAASSAIEASNPVTVVVDPAARLEMLADWLTGVMDSGQQAADDDAFFNIRLAAERIWTDREDGIWIYLEQAAAGSLDQPYRQRVYHVQTLSESTFVSDVYTLPDPDSAIGMWQSTEMLDEFGPGDLMLRNGCSVYLGYADNQFTGGTRGAGCHSELRGASYATSEVVVMAAGINSWDRGYDAAGVQVWGAEKGPYQFRR